MPPRRSYKKSTAGCTTCKLRRVKCDEVQPICGNCTRRGIPCNFAPKAINSTPCSVSSPRQISGPDRQQLAKPSSPITLPPTWALGMVQPLELRLIHHCTMMVFSTIAVIQDDPVRYIWSTEIFQLAFQSGPLSPLLDILLGVSAHHLQTLDPTDISVASAASAYFDRGLRTCNEMLSQIDENPCLLFTSSVLIALQAVLSRQEIVCGESYVAPIPWFRALRGVNVIASAGRVRIMDSKFKALLLDVPEFPIDIMQADTTFTGVWDALAGIADLGNETAYGSAVKHLHWIYVLNQRGEETHSLRRKLLAFPSRVSPIFMSLLEANDPWALVITAHFFALIGLVDEIWWLQGMAKREILGLLTVVPEDWMWAMEWPIQQVQFLDIIL
ncbi:hypothetical protein BDZ45DRAFT_725889 [Acephala macrosclerotiorum]|nr:hypothetical protein BDZ45DRAFT_725889 [Acephala macrosclerotiorum]